MFIQEEPLNYKLCFELLPLLNASKEEAYEEGSEIREKMKTVKADESNVDFDYYINAYKSGALQVVTLRNEEGELVGHFTVTLGEHPQCLDITVANTSNIHIMKEYRTFKIFNMMLKYTEQLLKEKGVSTLYVGIPFFNIRLCNLFDRMNFERKEVYFGKDL